MKADVVVVGAGIAGTALTYFLAEGGLRVVLVDRNFPGQGATGRSAGFLVSQHWNEHDAILARASREICSRAHPEGEAGFTTSGFLRVTTREDDVPVMRDRAKEIRRAGSTAEVISGRKLRRRFPWLGTSGLSGALFTPDDGYLDPYEVATGFLHQARDRGAELLVNSPVEEIEIKASRARGVLAGETTVEAESVVLAMGPWTTSLLQAHGLDLPMKGYRVQALVTAPIPDLPALPMLHEIPDGYYLRPEKAGLLVGDGTEYEEANPETYDREADFVVYTDLAAWLSQRIPPAAAAMVTRGWSGLCQATPDRLPLAGLAGGIEGLTVLAGFNGLGVMRAPPLAKSIAAEILGSRPSIDLTPFRPDRFTDSLDFPIQEGFTLR
ncbi:MAG: NAD(P)/FAD-dependent oxidoreductase [Thermoplasmata archaeon]